MSDIRTIRSLSGNFQSAGHEPWTEFSVLPRRRLVEECQLVKISQLVRLFSKKLLLDAVRNARPVRLPVLGGAFNIWLIDQPHRLPGRIERWSAIESGNCRLWLLCPRCRKPYAHLYYYYLSCDSLALSEIACRRCHRLVYMTKNVGRNQWYREAGALLKRLLLQKRRLLCKESSPHSEVRLHLIDAEIRRLVERLKPKAPARNDGLLRTSSRRPYKNIGLLQRWAELSLIEHRDRRHDQGKVAPQL